MQNITDAIDLEDWTFLAFLGGYVVSGIMLMVLAFMVKKVAERLINGVIGLAALGYAVYLAFFLEAGGTYYGYWYVFILPVLLLVQAIRGRAAGKPEAEKTATPAAQ